MMRLYCLVEPLAKAFPVINKQLRGIILTDISILSNAIFISPLNKSTSIKILHADAPVAISCLQMY